MLKAQVLKFQRNIDTVRKTIENPIFNFVWFYSIWLLCVVGGNNWILIPCLLLTLHHICVANRERELVMVVCVGAVGMVTDTLLSAVNVFVFADDLLFPLWLGVLWLAFASILNRSLKFLKRHSLLAMVGGGIGGALSYLSASYLGAVDFGYDRATTMIVLFVHWAILFPVSLYMAHHLSRRSWLER